MKFLTISFFLFFVMYGFTQEAVVAEVHVQGNKKLKTSFVKKIASMSSGSLLDSVLLESDIKRLKRLPAVAQASFEVAYLQGDAYKVIYQIVENFTIIPSANVYTSNDGEFAYKLGLYEFNLLGQNMIFGGYYQKDIYNSYGVNFKAPYLFNKQFGLALNYQDLTTQEPVFFENDIANYKYNNTSFEILALYEHNFQNRFELGVNFFTEDYTYKFGATDPEVPLELDAKKIMYKGIYEYNNLDFNYQYVTGIKSTLNLQYVTTNDDVLPEFLIGWNDFSYFKRVGTKGNWASRLRLGLSSNNDSPFAPFSVDNNLNIRGVGNRIDRGTGSIVLNTEYRETLLEKGWFVLQGNAFVDAGSWRNPGGEFDDFFKAESVRVYPGLGLRFMHKKIFKAIFRIDYGYGITKNGASGFVFGIGQYF
ncbi:outer membrane protein assembly factor [Flavobacteriales bacterium 34_180_T64]|nr:outer membrane protein assembly factor [Flavobacteriales bacterium 34_180_T64]